MITERNIPDTYQWSINPVRTFEELLIFAQDAIDNLAEQKDKEVQSEDILNIYFIFCAAQQILSDYIHSRGLMRVANISRKYFSNNDDSLSTGKTIAKLGTSIVTGITLPILEKLHFLHIHKLYRIHEKMVDICLILANHLYKEDHHLIASQEIADIDLNSLLKQQIAILKAEQYPEALKNSFLKIPTAFRDEPFSSADCFLLGERAALNLITHNRLKKILLVGLRTSGCYMVPLCLESIRHYMGAEISMITYRPGHGLFTQERNKILATIKDRDGMVILVDDAPYSGHTLDRACEELMMLGVPPSSMRILAPKFEEAPYWHRRQMHRSAKNSTTAQKPLIKAITIDRSSLALKNFLNANWVKEQLKDSSYFPGDLIIEDVTNEMLAHNEKERFSQSISYRPQRPFPRYRRIFKVKWLDQELKEQTKYVLAISVGQGIWGYGIKMLYENLSDFVPTLYTLNNGVALMEWCQSSKQISLKRGINQDLLNDIAAYILKRAKMPMKESMQTIYRMEAKGNGLHALSLMFSMGLGPLASIYEKILLASNKLTKFISNGSRCVIDGKIGPQEWLPYNNKNSLSFLKTSYDERAYDWSDLRIFDPVYDLAAAIFEYDLDEESEHLLTEKVGIGHLDLTEHFREKKFLYKMLYGFLLKRALTTSLSGNYSVGALPPETNRERILQEKLNARCANFLSRTISEYMALPVKYLPIAQQPLALFSIDVDNVVESESLGFSAPSKSAIEAFIMLKKAGFLPVLNSGRSLNEIKSRCAAFGIPYGIAEHGSVIWDAVQQKRLILPTISQMQQKERLLKALKRDKKIIIDEGFCCNIRAFTRKGKLIYALDKTKLTEYFNDLNITDLRIAQTAAKTDIAYQNIDKGSGLKALLDYLGNPSLPIYAIGDSIYDAPMLQLSDVSYAPLNYSPALSQLLSLDKKLIICPYPYQLGFHWAVKDALKRNAITINDQPIIKDELSTMFSQHEKLDRLMPYVRAFKRLVHPFNRYPVRQINNY